MDEFRPASVLGRGHFGKVSKKFLTNHRNKYIHRSRSKYSIDVMVAYSPPVW